MNLLAWVLGIIAETPAASRMSLVSTPCDYVTVWAGEPDGETQRAIVMPVIEGCGGGVLDLGLQLPTCGTCHDVAQILTVNGWRCVPHIADVATTATAEFQMFAEAFERVAFMGSN